jgi:phenylacetic acid degradation operon negative regulatory protein
VSPGEIQPQELVVTLLGLFARDGNRLLWSGGLVELLGEFGFSHAAARIALGRVVDRGILERHKDGRLVSYLVTPRTEELIAVGDRRLAEFATERDWNGVWSLIWYSIPDEMRRERHRLGRRLRFLGFGPLEDSTWIAPWDHRDDANEYMARLGVAEMCGMLVGEIGNALGSGRLIDRAWEVDAAIERYKLFATEFDGYRRRKRLSESEAFVVTARLANTYRRFPYIDPGLPQDLFAAARYRAAAIDLYTQLMERFLAPAQRHFDAAVEPR